MKQLVAIAAIFLLLAAGCTTPLTPRESGTLTGAGVGAATGAILGGIAGSAGTGAAVGAAVGALTGAIAGDAIQREQAAAAASRGYPYGPPPPPPPPYYAPYPPQPPVPSAFLQLEVTPEDTEIMVDGRRIGLVSESPRPMTVPVVAGPHSVELSWRGFSVTQQVVVSPHTTVVIKRNLAPSALAVPPPIAPGGTQRPPSY